jgi:hypothetical protein
MHPARRTDMRPLPLIALATIAVLSTPALYSAENAAHQGPYEEAPLLTLSGKVFILAPEQLESPGSVGVFVAEGGRQLQMKLTDATLLPEIKKHHGKAMTLQGHLQDEGKTFLVQQLPPPGREPTHDNREM